jgi:hypothetical protein
MTQLLSTQRDDLPSGRIFALFAAHMAESFHPDIRAALLKSFVQILTDTACSIMATPPPLERHLAYTITNATNAVDEARPPSAFMSHLLTRDACTATLRFILS